MQLRSGIHIPIKEHWRGDYVVDNFCDPFSAVAPWSRQQLYLGRVYSPIACTGGHRTGIPTDHGSKSGLAGNTIHRRTKWTKIGSKARLKT